MNTRLKSLRDRAVLANSLLILVLSGLALETMPPVASAADNPASTRSNRVASGVSQPVPRLRYPIALALADQGKLLLVANERSGTVSIVDVAARRVRAECPIGKRLSDLIAVPALGPSTSELFLCTDSGTGELKLLMRHGDDLNVVDSSAVGPFPSSVCIGQHSQRCFVASLWSRQLNIVDLVRDGTERFHLKVSRVVPLPFAPRLQALSPDGSTLIVAGAFGGELALVNASSAKLETIKSLPGQNLRGLRWSSDRRRLFVSHQTVNRLAYTTPEDLHWGSVVSNVLRSLDRDALEGQKTDFLTGSQVVQLGEVGNGAGDPASIAIMRDGTLAVALAGVGEVALGRFETGRFRRVSVGIRPTALLTSADERAIYVADTFGDSIAILPLSAFQSASAAKELVQISLGSQPPLSAVDRGERLFFDARLGLEKWMSCHSCHPDGHSSDALSDTLGDGSFGAAKRIPSLGGVAETGPWAWNGSVKDLGAQVRKSMETTLRTKSVTDAQVNDLTAYLQTLKPAPPPNPSPDASERLAIERGRAVFTREKCDRCHVPPTFTSPRLYDVGLRDELGNRQFNPPSLRGVGQRAAFFHDGRATSLRDVFAVHRHPGDTRLPDADLADLIAFLRSL